MLQAFTLLSPDLAAEERLIVSDGAVTIEVFGRFGKFLFKNGFLNICTDPLDMHIRGWKLGLAFSLAVRIPLLNLRKNTTN